MKSRKSRARDDGMLSGEFDKRGQLRANINWPVSIKLPRGTIKSETKNISAGGAWIFRDQPSVPGEILSITLEPPNHSPIETSAEVVWVGKVLQLGMGVQFVEISEEGRNLISKAVSDHLKSERTHWRAELSFG